MVIIENETSTENRKETFLAERSQRFYAFCLDSLFSFSVSFCNSTLTFSFHKGFKLNYRTFMFCYSGFYSGFICWSIQVSL